MKYIHQLMNIVIPLLQQRSPLYALILIAPHRIILFLDGVSKINSSGCDREQGGFPLVLFLTVGFPLALDMGGGFEECKSNLFPTGKVMNREISF